MIQRIQSIYLLIVVFLSGLLFLLPISVFQCSQETSELTVCGITGLITWPLLLLDLIILIIALITVFLYKKRLLQIRLCVFNAVLCLGFYALFAYYAYKFNADNVTMTLKLPIVFPFLNVILNYLALRAIGRDEALIRSVEHLR